MKKLLFPIMLIVFTLTGCKSDFSKFEVPFSGKVQMHATKASIIPDTVTTPDVLTNIDSILLSNDISSSMVKKVSLKKLNLVLESPLTGDLTFLKSVVVYITSNGMDDVKIAEIEEMPSCAAETYELTLEDVCVKYFMLKQKFQLKVIYTTDKNITEDQIINLSMRYQFE